MNVIIRMMTITLVAGTCYAKSGTSSSRPSSFRHSSVSRSSTRTFHPTTPTKPTTNKSPTVKPSHTTGSVANHSEVTQAPAKTTKPTMSAVNKVHTKEKTSQSIGPRITMAHNYHSWSSHPSYQTGFLGYHPFTYWYLYYCWSRPNIVDQPVKYPCEKTVVQSNALDHVSWNGW